MSSQKIEIGNYLQEKLSRRRFDGAKKPSDYEQLNFHIVISQIILYLFFRFRTRTD